MRRFALPPSDCEGFSGGSRTGSVVPDDLHCEIQLAHDCLDCLRAGAPTTPGRWRQVALQVSPLPCGHWVQPSASCWGSPGSTPGRGCVRLETCCLSRADLRCQPKPPPPRRELPAAASTNSRITTRLLFQVAWPVGGGLPLSLSLAAGGGTVECNSPRWKCCVNVSSPRRTSTLRLYAYATTCVVCSQHMRCIAPIIHAHVWKCILWVRARHPYEKTEKRICCSWTSGVPPTSSHRSQT